VTGAAIIKDRHTGHVFVADWAQTDGRAVTFKGSLRVRALSGDRLYPPRLRTLPLDHVSIDWQIEVAA
jgi:hypothetical protein